MVAWTTSYPYELDNMNSNKVELTEITSMSVS